MQITNNANSSVDMLLVIIQVVLDLKFGVIAFIFSKMRVNIDVGCFFESCSAGFMGSDGGAMHASLSAFWGWCCR